MTNEWNATSVNLIKHLIDINLKIAGRDKWIRGSRGDWGWLGHFSLFSTIAKIFTI